MIIIPDQTTRDFQQKNTSDIIGNIWASKNVDFNDDGYIKLHRRATALIKDVSNFGAVTSIESGVLSSGSFAYFIVTDGHLFKVTGDGAYSDLNGTGHIGSGKYDGQIWQGRWYVSQTSSLSYYDGSSWTTGIGTLSNDTFHPLCVNAGLNYIAVGDANTVVQYDSSHTTKTTLTIPATYNVRRILYNNSNYYIFTKNIYGGDAMMFIWDGTTTTAQYGFVIPNCSWAFSAVIYKGSPVVMSSNGQLLKFNGGGFDEIAHLPVARTSYTWYDGTGFNGGKVPAKGMVVRGDFIYVNIDGTVSGGTTYLPNQPSGVWIYDPSVGLYHAGGATSNYVFNESGTATASTDTIVISNPAPATGTKILFTASASIGGLSSIATIYYCIYVTSSSIKLAESYSDAVAGTAIDITADGAVSNLVWHADTDFMQSESSISYPGAICLVGENDSTISTLKNMTVTKVLFGATFDNEAYSGTSKGLYSFTQGNNRGYFIMQKLFSTDIKDSWPKSFVKFNNVVTGADKVVVKFRSNERLNGKLYLRNQSVGAVWVDSSCFSTAGDITDVQTGDEVEILSGAGSGCTAHITSTQLVDGGKYFIFLDETIPGITAGQTASFIINNFKKFKNGVGTMSNVDQFVELGGADKSKWIQYKIELRGISDPYFEELQVINSADKKPE